MKRILIVKLWALGDILLATPVLRALKRQFPDCHVTWVVEDTHAGILYGNPLIDDVIALDLGTWRRQLRRGNLISYFRTAFRLRRILMARRFDAVINLTPEKWWSVWFVVAPLRIGVFPSVQQKWVRWYYTKAIFRSVHPWQHNTHHYLRAAEALGIQGPYDEQMVLAVPIEDRRAALEFLNAEKDHDPQKPLVILHPGTSQPSKCWPPSSYAALAAALSEHFNVVITGSPKENVLAEDIVAALPAGTPRPLIAAGQLHTIQQAAALIESAAVVITGDTSILHIASALATPVVGIFGSTRPGDNVPLFGPNILLFDDDVSCAPCYKAQCPFAGEKFMRCQRAVTPQQVLIALQTLLENSETVHEPCLR